MKKILPPILIGIFLLIFLSSACTSRAEPASTPLATMLPGDRILTSTSLPLEVTNTPLTPIIPITGENVVEMQCQFCVNDLTHAVFIFPDFALFDVESTSPVTCLTAEVINGKRVLVCNGTQLTTFNLKICSDASNCLLFPVALQGCPLVPNTGGQAVTTTPATPVFLTAINTLRPPGSTPDRSNQVTSQAPTATPGAPTPTGIQPTVPPILTTAAPPPATSTSEPVQPTATDAPTDPPPPPEPTQPPTTPEPTNDNKKPTKTPKS